MKTVKSRKIKNKNTKPAISFDDVEVSNVKTSDASSKVRKRKVYDKSTKKVNTSNDKSDIKSFHKFRKRKLKKYNSLTDDFLDKKKDIFKSNEDLEGLQDQIDKEIENEDNLSIGLIILILSVCLVVGFVAGYMAYRLIFS